MDIAEGENEAVDYRLNDQVNEAYTLVYAASSFISPLIGGYLDTHYGFRKTFDIAAIINIVFGLIIFTCNCGINVMSEDREFRQ